MAILKIKRDLGTPSIVRIECDDTLATALGATYLVDQADNIEDINNGAFEWADNDAVMIAASDAVGMARYDETNDALASTQPYQSVYAAQYTTAGGAAAEAITVTGLQATDLAFVQVVDDGTGSVTALQAVCTADTLTVTFSADPQNDTIINYHVIRP